MKLSKKRLQLVLILSVFLAMSTFVMAPSLTEQSLFEMPTSSMINQDASLVGSDVTVGDVLIMFSLFGTTVSIMVWVTQYRRGR